MIITAPRATGDAYVDSCFQFDFEEFEETRMWGLIPGIKDIPLIADKDPRKALEAADTALKDYADYSFVFFWVGKLKGKLGYPDEPRNTYLEGLQKGRNKPILCGGIAMWEFEHGNLAEAVKWWIKSCAIQLSCNLSTDGFSVLNLAYIAGGLNLPQYKASLLKKAKSISSIDFDSIGASQRYQLAGQQGNASIIAAISLLCEHYKV